MSVTDAPETFSEMVEDLRSRVRSKSGETATDNIFKRFLNLGLRTMHIKNGDMFPWAQEEDVLTLRKPYSDGLVTVTKGTVGLTGVADPDSVSPAWITTDEFGIANARKGGKLTIGGGFDVYEVASVIIDGFLTLNNQFISTTIDGTTQTDNGATYNYFEDTYDLNPAFLRPLDHRNFDNGRKIKLWGRQDFQRLFTRNRITGIPSAAFILHRSTTSSAELTPSITFHPPPSKEIRIHYSFVTKELALSSSGSRQRNMSADTDEPVVPVPYRSLIVTHALWHWYRDRKDDSRANEALGEYAAMLSEVVSDNEVGSNKPHINPAASAYARRASVPWRSYHGGRFDIGNRFDRGEDPFGW